MSASTERKNRQAARSEGTYAKDIASRKEAAKKKKQKTRYTVWAIVIVLFFAFAIYFNTGSLYRSLTGLTVTSEAVTAGDSEIPAINRSFSVAECNYVYNMQYVSLVNTYGSYISMLGLDTTQPLDEQECPMGSSSSDEDGSDTATAGTSAGTDTAGDTDTADADAPEATEVADATSAPEATETADATATPEATADTEDVYTWDDYFKDAAKSTLTQLAAYEAYANANGITLTDEDKTTVDETIDSIAETAEENNYGSASKFLAANYGRGCNESVARDVIELQTLASRVQTTITDAESYTDEQLAEKYDSVKDSYDKFTYSYYLVTAATETDEDGNAADPTEEALAAAKATAESILASVNEGSALADAVAAAVTDAEPTAQDAVAGSSVESALSDWLKSADRVEGDSAVIDADSGSYVVVFTSRDNNQAPTEESGDQNYCDYIAEQLLDQDVLNDWNTDVFSKLTEVCSAQFGSTRYIGR